MSAEGDSWCLGRRLIAHGAGTWPAAAARHPPVASQSAEMEFMEEMRCASMALAVSLASSADHRLARRMRSWGTQCAYTLQRCRMVWSGCGQRRCMGRGRQTAGRAGRNAQG